MQWGGWAKDKTFKWFSDLKLIQKKFFTDATGGKHQNKDRAGKQTAVLSAERIGSIFPERSEGGCDS